MRGAIAPMAAVLILPITLLGFGAVEFHRYTMVRTSVQDALDAAALAVARSTATDAGELQRLGEAVMRAQVRFDANLRLTAFTATRQSGRVVANANIAVSPIVANMFIPGDLTIRGHSEVVREVWGLEVALVLDATGSMATNNRIGIAKTAAQNFVSEMERVAGDSSNPSAVKIGLVPFAATVNVGPQHEGATWMDLNAQSPTHSAIFTNHRGQPVSANRFTLLNQMRVPWAGCVESRPMPFDIQDTAPSASNPATLFVPYFAPDEPDVVNDPTFFSNDARWNSVGPVHTQAYPNSYIFDLGAGIYGFNSGTGFMGLPWADLRINSWGPQVAPEIMTHAGGARGVQGVTLKYVAENVDAAIALGLPNPRTSRDAGPNRNCKVAPVTRITDDGASVIADIQAMTIGGSTNIPMGLMWGWHLLSPRAPFADGQPYRKRGNTKIIVLMTDGENSLPVIGGGNTNTSDYTGVGYTWNNRIGATGPDAGALSTALNNRLAALCTNVKNEGIILYTVRLEMTGSNAMLQTCASEPAMAFDVTNAAALDETFQKIAKSIQNLRVSR